MAQTLRRLTKSAPVTRNITCKAQAAYLAPTGRSKADVAGCELPCDIIGTLLREDDLIVNPIRFEDGSLLVPDAPGLGVELDRDALERYRVPVE